MDRLSCPPRPVPGHFFLPLALLTLTALVYWPGLRGGFYFDDLPHIVLNPFVHIDTPGWEALLRAATSSNAGPTGRPLAMLSFALDYWRLGALLPAGFKSTNLVLHLINGILVGLLLRRVLSSLGLAEHDARRWAWFAAGVWLLHPLQVSTVLYTVQRMTILAALFMLLGLYGYFSARQAGRWPWALASLAAGTILAVLSKETGLLALPYAVLLEVFVLRWRNLGSFASRLLKSLYACGALLYLGSVIYIFVDPEWATRAYSEKPFTLYERMLTELRVLVDYQRQIVLPHLPSMGLHHDTYPISRTLFSPPGTFFSLLWHLALLALMIFFRQRAPLLGFGLAWFYVSHLLESTVWPLELIFEHRNYLALLAWPLVLLGAARYMGARVALATRLRSGRRSSWAAWGLLALVATATAVRAADWGDWIGHALAEAARHPDSPRAQFDAGQTLGMALVQQPEQAALLLPQAKDYLWRATELDSNDFAALVSLIFLELKLEGRAAPETLQRLCDRLRSMRTNIAASINLHALNQLFLEPSFQAQLAPWAQRYFAAALSNPHLRPLERAEVLVGRALWGQGNGRASADNLQDLRQAVQLVPSKLDYHVLLAAMLIDAGLLEEARSLLAITDALDTWGFLREEVRHLERKLVDK